MPIKHTFVSAKADAPDSTFVKPSDWNDEHDFISDSGLVWIGQDVSGPGPMQEFPVDAGAGDDMTMMTKQQVTAAIVAAMAGVVIPASGDLIMSMLTAKSGWLLCNGQTLGNVGSGADFASAAALNLFTLLWGLNGGGWPVTPARGASAAADWAALKRVATPDARGCVFGMRDLAAGVNGLIVNLGIKVGAANVPLTITNIPSHDHSLPDPLDQPQQGNLGGIGGGSPINNNSSLPVVRTGVTGGNPAAVPPFSAPVPVAVTQPTMGVNLFIKL